MSTKNSKKNLNLIYLALCMLMLLTINCEDLAIEASANLLDPFAVCPDPPKVVAPQSDPLTICPDPPKPAAPKIVTPQSDPLTVCPDPPKIVTALPPAPAVASSVPLAVCADLPSSSSDPLAACVDAPKPVQSDPLAICAEKLPEKVQNLYDAGEDCFYDSVNHIVDRLTENIAKISSLCKIDSDPNVKILFDAASTIGQLEAYNTTLINKDTLTKVQNYVNLPRNWTFTSKAADYAHAKTLTPLPANLNELSSALWKSIEEDWNTVVKNSDFPVFYKTNILKVLKYKRNLEILKFLFASNLRQCLPNDFGYAVSFFDLPATNSTDHYDLTKTTCKNEAFDFVIDPLYFSENNGVAISFWVEQNLKDLQGKDKLNVFEGYASNVNVYEYNLVKIDDSTIGNNFVVNGEKINIPSNSTCSESVFVLITFQKDCDHYKMITQLRSIGSNTKFAFSRPVTAHLVESVTFNFMKPQVTNPKMYKDFVYSDSRSIAILTDNIDQTKLTGVRQIARYCAKRISCSYSDNTGGCLNCAIGKMNFNGNCIDYCPDGYIKQVSTCVKCDDKCSKCTSVKNGDCQACNDPFILFGSTCQANCPDNMFSVGKKCQSCTDNCTECKDATTCKKCNTDFFLNSLGKCVKDCGIGNYSDVLPNECKKCPASCSTCSALNKCTICADGFFLSNNQCVRNCPDTFFNDKGSKICQSCPKFCKTCQDGVKCDVCQDGFNYDKELRKCFTDCPIGTASNNKICSPCGSNCDHCDPNNTSTCQQCNDKTFLKEGVCVSNCGDKYYLDVINKKCLKCNDDCTTCTKDICYKCANNKLIYNSNSCISNCPDGYIPSAGSCIKCQNPLNCMKCTSDLKTCSKCYSSQLLLEGKCVDKCYDGFYKSGPVCDKCPAGCKTCTDAFTCTDCLDKFFQKGNTCVSTCGTGFTADVKNVCQKCTVLDCDTCDSTKPTTCTKCQNNKYLYTNKCYNTCPVGTFFTPTFTCENCIKDCDTCDSKNSCSKCNSSQVLQGNVCMSDCLPNFIPVLGKCTQCKTSSCQKCNTTLDRCTECPLGKFLHDGNCLTTCPENTYTKSNQCVDCSSPCLQCKDATTCTKCVKTFVLNGTKCTDNCPDALIRVGDNCEKCTSINCSKCETTNKDQCHVCLPGFNLLNGNCLATCPEHYFAQNFSCKPCSDNCKTCSSPTVCSKCDDGKFLKDGVCVGFCGDNYVQDGTNCVHCKSNCKKCLSTNPSTCTECYDKTALFQGDCRTECPEGTWRNVQKLTCDNCQTVGCAKCDNGILCKQCSAGKFLLSSENTCVSACPEGYTTKDQTCVKCEVTRCKTCPSANTKICTTCVQNNFLYMNKCDIECPASTYKDTSLGQCTSCDINCLNCTDSKKCTKCMTNYFMYNDKCVKDCPDSFTKVADKCQACTIDGCKTCTDPNTCITCLAPQLLYQNSCNDSCPMGTYDDQAGKCQPCTLNCGMCTDGTTCIKCFKGKNLTVDKICSDNCPDNYSAVNGLCVKCKDALAKTCDGQTTTHCLNNMVILDKKCIANCPPINYFESSNRICTKCLDFCQTCKDVNTCDKCIAGHFLLNNKCVDACPVGQYSSNGKCVACDKNCDVCSNGKCTTCSAGTFLENGTCVIQCSKGFYKGLKECLRCDDNCIDCTWVGSCTICAETFFNKLGKCETSCGIGYGTVEKTCLPCDKGCDSCTITNTKKDDKIERTSQCLACTTPSVLFNFTCRDVCPAGTFKNDKSVCTKCPDNCDNCSDATTCLTCKTDFMLQPDNKTCRNTCPDGFRINKTSCQKCTVNNCKTCKISVDTCDDCKSTFSNLNNLECLTACPANYFSINQHCQKCVPPCLSCQDANTCKTCLESFDLVKNTCVAKCDTGHISIRGECQHCADKSCKICAADLTTCLQCNDGKALIENTIMKMVTPAPSASGIHAMHVSMQNVLVTSCLDNCGDGMFKNAQNKCLTCINNCNKCSNSKECDVCIEGFHLLDGVCKERCDDHFVEKNSKCVRCDGQQCLSCDSTNLSKCNRCDPGYSLKNNVCVLDCGDNFFPQMFDKISICGQCKPRCTKCKDDKSCDTCFPNFFNKNNECVVDCGVGFYADAHKTCEKCTDPDCAECKNDAGNKDVCFKCISPMVLQGSQCAKSCKDGFYPDINNTCQKCTDTNCLSCLGKDTCSRCQLKFVSHMNKCIPNCPVNYVANNQNICMKCTQDKCGVCQSDDQNKCTKCTTGFLHLSKCIPTCPDGFFGNNSSCVECSKSCSTCTDLTKCTTCAGKLVMDTDGNCKDNCPPGKVEADKKCLICTQKNCDKCDAKDLNSCTTCSGINLLFKGTCVNTCPKGSFASGLNCLPCDSKCLDCHDGNSCLRCSTSFFLQKGQCVDKCPTSLFGQSIDGVNTCENCDDRCENCTGKNQCSKCFAPYFYENSKCVAKCQVGNFQNDKSVCVPCTENCQDCLNTTTCHTCRPGFNLYQGKCIKTCPNTTTPLLGVCLSCTNNNCLICDPSSLSSCTTCPENKFLYRRDCISTCPDKTFYDKTANTCLPCDSKCMKCTDAKTCTKCLDSFFLEGTNCISNCPDGKVARGDACFSCQDTNCKICSNSDLTKCSTCSSGYLFRDKEICVKKCPDGFRGDDVTKTCKSCSGNCKTCDETKCLTCVNTFYFAENTNNCVTCKSPDLIIENTTCAKCTSSSCHKCVDNTPTLCQVCDVSKALYKGHCLDTCPLALYRSDDTCKSCTKDCARCTDGLTCLECSKTTVLYNNQCLSTCPEGWVANASGECKKCTQGDCLKCQAENLINCITCKPDTFIFQLQCYKNCPEKTYPSGITCINCPDTCQTCDATKCLKCKDGLRLKGTQCVATCGQGFIDDGKLCVQCADINCVNCETASKCSLCKDGTFLFKADGACKTVCPKETFADKVKKECVGCDTGCLNCDVDKCLLCKQGLYLVNGRCQKTCPDGNTNLNGVCTKCIQNTCLKCFPEDPTKCLSCSTGKFLYQNNCIDKCPLSTFVDSTKLNCLDCDKSCLDCKDLTTCITCKQEFHLIEGKCENHCPDGKVALGGKCISCADEKCKTCLADVTKCISCLPPSKLTDNTCRASCPDGSFAITASECKKCSTGCDSCGPNDVCTKCQNGFFLSNGKCTKNCATGFYGDCAERTCKTCNAACKECHDGSSTDCTSCNLGYFKSGKDCVKAENCKIGTYANSDKLECISCDVLYCADCANSTTCKSCQRGFQLDQDKHCVEAQTLLNVITPSPPQLFSRFTAKNQSEKEILSFNDQLKGVAVSNSGVSFSFWLRKLKNSAPGIIFFETKSATNNIQSFSMTTKSNDSGVQLCQFIINNSNFNKSTILQTIDCSYIALYDWKYFLINITQNKDFTSVLRIKIENNGKLNDYSINIPVDSYGLVSKDTQLLFNQGNSSYDAFEITNFNLLDFYPTDPAILGYYGQKPEKCDYMCSDCRGICYNCSNGKVNSDGYCPAGFLPVKPFVASVNTPITFNLREKITKRIVSDRYSLAFFFYVTNLSSATMNLASLHYDTLDETVNKFANVLSINIINRKIVLNNSFNFDNQDVKGNTWYMIVVGIKENSANLYLREWQASTAYKQEREFVKNISRSFDDLTITLGNVYAPVTNSVQVKGSIFNAQFYVNNLPLDTDIQTFFTTLKLSDNCSNLGEDLTCVLCNDGYKLSDDKKCVDNSLDQTTMLLDKVSIFRNDSMDIPIPSSQLRSSYAISMFIRKKKLSIDTNSTLINTVFSVVDSANPNNRIPLITQSNDVNYGTIFKFGFGPDNKRNDTLTISHNYSNEIPDFFHVVINVDTIAKSISYNVGINENGANKTYTASGDFKTPFTTLAVGDKASEVNLEVSWTSLYQKPLNSENILKLRSTKPKDCDAACIDCNYQTGKCNVCVQKSTTSYNVDICPVFLKGFTSTFLYTTLGYADMKNPDVWVNNLKDDFKRDVNSLQYSMIGYFKILDFSKYSAVKNGKFEIARLTNFDNIIDAPNVPGRHLISLEIVVTNNNPVLNWVIDEIDQPTYIPISPQPNLSQEDWIFVNAGVSVTDKTFTYRTVFNGATQPAVIYKLKNYPPRLSERASLKVFGMASGAKDYLVPNGHMFEFYFSPNYGYQENIFTKFQAAKTLPANPTCKAGCLKCVADANSNNICIHCASDFTLTGNDCISNVPKTIPYLMLNDNWDDLSSAKINVSKFDFSSSNKYSLSFYFRRNYFASDDSKSNNLIVYGSMTISYSGPATGNQFYMTVSFKGESSSVKLGPFDSDDSLDYQWHSIIISITGGKSVTASFKTVTDPVVLSQATLITPFIFDSTVIVTVPNTIGQIYGLHLSELITEPLVKAPLYDCDYDCDSCYKGDCKSWTNGVDSTGLCNAGIVKLENTLISNDKVNNPILITNYKLSDYLGKKRLLRSKVLSIYFNVEINCAQDTVSILKFSNNDVYKDANNINSFLTLTYTKSLKKFTVKIGNRFLAFKSKILEYDAVYPLTPKTNLHHISLSYDGNAKTVVFIFANTKDNIISGTIPFLGMSDYMTQFGRVYLTNYFDTNTTAPVTENFIYRDFVYHYNSANSFSVAEVTSKLEGVQDICNLSGYNTCITGSCPVAADSGMCTLNKIATVHHANDILQLNYLTTNITTETFKTPNFSKVSISFWFRRITYDIKPYGVLKLFKGDKKSSNDPKAVYLSVIYDTNNLKIHGVKGTGASLSVANVYDPKDQFDWLHITITYDVTANNITAFIYNTHSGLTVSRSNNLNTAPTSKDMSPVPLVLYTINYGFTDSDIATLSDAYAFEVSNIHLTPEVLISSDVAVKYRPRAPRDCSQTCRQACDKNNVCDPDYILQTTLPFNDLFADTKTAQTKDVTLINKTATLFRTISQFYKLTSTPSISEYLISLEIDPLAYLASAYVANKDIIFSVSNNAASCSGNLMMGDLMPESSYKYGVFSVVNRSGSLRVYMGSNQGALISNFYDIPLKSNIKEYKKIYISISFNSNTQFAKMFVFADDVEIVSDNNFDFRSQPLTIGSFIYTHPAIQNVRLNFHNPRFDYDFDKNLYTSSTFTDNTGTPNGICTGTDKNCSKCISLTSDISMNCYRCVNGYKLVNNICVVDSIKAPVKMTQTVGASGYSN